MTSPQLQILARYLALLESFEADPAAFADILHPEFQQLELPNLLNPAGQQSDRAECLSRMARGRHLLRSQTYEVLNHVEDGAQVVLEARWTGVMALDAGPLRQGQTLVARFCFVCELRDGLLYRQRNYDCFEPFGGA